MCKYSLTMRFVTLLLLLFTKFADPLKVTLFEVISKDSCHVWSQLPNPFARLPD